MRSQVAVQSSAKSLRFVAAVLLAGVASGCSSDVTRFDGLFSSKSDTITTNSIPHKTNALNGSYPTPRADINAGNQIDTDVTGDAAINQPYPGQVAADVSYKPVNTATAGYSGARAAVTPIAVERSTLNAPVDRSSLRVARAEPLPVKHNVLVSPGLQVKADPISTGTIRSNWKVTDASPRILIKSGQTLSGISAQYSVPQAEILRANGMKSAADLKFGRSIVIPVAARAEIKANPELRLAGDKKLPQPGRSPVEDKAILPGTEMRDRSKLSSNAKLDAKNATPGDNEGSFYVVQEGDSLARIAKQHKVSIDALKHANGLETASIRIGQKLRMPSGDVAARDVSADRIKTASIQTNGKVKDVADSRPAGYTPPAADKSVADVQKSSDDGEKAPDDSGIAKYRWPVRGAVIAGYGQNVEGIRNPGIDISVPEGTPVKAAENGVVIYSGSGLKDLGNTVLVRHDDGTVTVYGNAAGLNVKRGDKVTRGQVIASSGMSGGAKRPKLHFEVRQKSEPVNPMTFLQ